MRNPKNKKVLCSKFFIEYMIENWKLVILFFLKIIERCHRNNFLYYKNINIVATNQELLIIIKILLI